MSEITFESLKRVHQLLSEGEPQEFYFICPDCGETHHTDCGACEVFCRRVLEYGRGYSAV